MDFCRDCSANILSSLEVFMAGMPPPALVILMDWYLVKLLLSFVLLLCVCFVIAAL